MASTIVTKNSSTASAVPVSGDLTQGELAVNVTDKKLYTKNSGGTVVELGTTPTSLTTGAISGTTLAASGAVTLSGGTANGIAYLNGSKVVTTGSALTFNGTNTFTVIPATGTGYNRTESTQYSTWLQTGAGNANVFWEFSAGTPVRWVDTSAGELMRLTSTGLGIGVTSPGARLETVAGTGAQFIGTFRTGDSTAANNAGGGFYGVSSATAGSRQAIMWLDADGANFGGGDYFYINKVGNSGNVELIQQSSAAMTFQTTGTERARITSGGYFKASNNGSYYSSSGAYHEFNQSIDNLGLAVICANASFTNRNLYLEAARNTTNGTFNVIEYYNSGAAAYKFRVADSGNVTNTNNSYGAISDAKLKDNIVDATPKLADLMKVQVRNYNLKSDPEHKQIGVIAQELEQVFPGMVDEAPDRDAEGNDLGTTTKQVKYSVFVPMLIKALQEQQAIIETLTARITAIESKGA